MNNYRNNNRGNYYRGRNSNRGGGGGYRGRSRFKKVDARLNESMFIKHANPEIKIEEYVPKISFDKLDINKKLKENILSKGFTSPTPIQDQAIPHIINEKDLVGIANTGTGKTIAFLLPLIDKVFTNRKNKVLIIAPTRELADQINDELYLLARDLGIYSVLCTGGNNLYRQINNIRRGYSFIIGTPGRLKDLHDRKVIDFSKFTHVVLDEVDRMLDMGFIEDIKYLVAALPKERQSLFFSATMDEKVEKIMRIFLKLDYVKVSVKTGETAANVDQDVIRIQNHSEKVSKLEEILKKEECSKVLVFVNTKRQVDKVCYELRDKDFRVEAIHGDKRQRERDRAIDYFKSGKSNVLIATDVAARGLDISNVSHVINYDIPNNYEDYIHRIGRTGRANKKGIALTFVENKRH